MSLRYRLLQEITQKNAQSLFPRFLGEKKRKQKRSHYLGRYTLSHWSIQFSLSYAHAHARRDDKCACEVKPTHAHTSARAAAVPHAWSTTRVCVRSLGGGDWRSTPRRLDGGDKEMYTGGMGRVVTIPAHGILCCEWVKTSQSVSHSVKRESEYIAVALAHELSSPFALGGKKRKKKRVRDEKSTRDRGWSCAAILQIPLPWHCPFFFIIYRVVGTSPVRRFLRISCIRIV